MNRLSHWLAATLLVAAGALSAAPHEGLVVNLSVPAPMVRGDVDVIVNVSVTNVSRAPITLLRWELPTERPEASLFRITRDGQPVAYTGPRIKRAAPAAEDYVRIESGATLNYAVELTAAYDLSRNGSYAIEYISKGARDTSAASLRSQPLYFWLEARSGRGAPPVAAVDPGTQNLASITFTGNCSASRQTDLINAVAAATTYSDNAVNYFSSSRWATQRFVKWFGPGSRASWATARRNFVAIQDAFVTKPLTLDCSCTQSYYAYVFPSQPYKIYLCNAFWAAPMLGTDSKAGTLIHEMSHFDVVAGTDDWAYGQAAAAALAISNPAQALNNADSHEYFAENTPVLP